MSCKLAVTHSTIANISADPNIPSSYGLGSDAGRTAESGKTLNSSNHVRKQALSEREKTREPLIMDSAGYEYMVKILRNDTTTSDAREQVQCKRQQL